MSKTMANGRPLLMFKSCFRFILPSSCFHSQRNQVQLSPGFYVGTIVALKGMKVIIAIGSRFYETLDLDMKNLRLGDPVYVLRQDPTDILTAPAQIEAHETLCKVLFLRSTYIVVQTEEERVLVLPWEYREDQEPPLKLWIKREGDTLEVKETRRKLVDSPFTPDTSTLTNAVEGRQASTPSYNSQVTFSAQQFRSYGSITDGENDGVVLAPLALPSPHTEESPLSRQSQECRFFPESEKMRLVPINGLDDSVMQKLQEIAEKWRYCGEGKIGALLGLSVGWLEVLTCPQSTDDDFTRFLSSLYEFHPSAACLSTLVEELQFTHNLTVLRSYLTTEDAIEALEMQSFRLLARSETETPYDTTAASDTSPRQNVDFKGAADKTKARIRVLHVRGEKVSEAWYIPETESLPAIQLVRLDQSYFLLCPNTYH